MIDAVLRLGKAALRRALRASGLEISRSESVVRIFPTRETPYGLAPTRDLARLLGADAIRTIFDVGANDGRAARAWAAEFPHAEIWAFEPAAEPFAQLSQVCAEERRIKAFPLALSDVAGTGRFHTNRYSTLGSLLPIRPTFPYGQSTGAVEVATERLDELVRRSGVGSIDVLKLDVQGFELPVLRGAGSLLAEGRVTALLCELAFEPIYEGQSAPAELLAFLAAAGFRLVCFYEMSPGVDGLAGWTDALFVHPRAARMR